MILSGGAAAKFGDRYEGLWTTLQFGNVLSGKADAIIVEPVGTEGTGVEFTVYRKGDPTYHQCKTKSRGSWTLRSLEKNGVLEHCRSKLEAPHARFVFTSDATCQLRGLCEGASRSGSPDVFAHHLSRSEDLQTLTEIWQVTNEQAWDKLRRVEVSVVDIVQLKASVENLFASLVEGDPVVARLIVGELAATRLHTRITDQDILDHLLATSGMAPMKWRHDSIPSIKFRDARQRYALRTLDTNDILGQVSRPEAAELFEKITASENRVLTLVGPSGSGKSYCVMELTKKLESSGWTVLPFRLDSVGNFNSDTQLGAELELGIPPYVALDRARGGRPGILVVDQLDAVGTVDGRKPSSWPPLFEMLTRTLNDTQLKILLVCRAFDFENDARLRSLVAGTESAPRVHLKPLKPDEVRRALETLPARHELSPQQLEILTSPVCLQLYAKTADEEFSSSFDLFTAYWRRSEDQFRQLPSSSSMASILDAIVDRMSEGQRLFVEDYKLDGHHWEHLASLGMLKHTGNQVAFFHESFFDFVFARRYLARRGDLIHLLSNEEQSLFRRSQVRQLLETLRASDSAAYRKSLAFVLRDPGVRPHIKKCVWAWLTAILRPSSEEFEIAESALTRPDHNDFWTLLRRSEAWSRLAHSRGILKTALFSEDDHVSKQAASVLRWASQWIGDEVAVLCEELKQKGPRWDPLVDELLRSVELRGSRRLFDLAVSHYARGSADVQLLAEHHPGWAVEMAAHQLGPILDNYVQRRTVERRYPTGADLLDDSGHRSHLLPELAKAAPGEFLHFLLPLFVRLVTAHQWTKSSGAEWQPDTFWMGNFVPSMAHGLSEAFLRSTVECLRSLPVGEFRNAVSTLSDSKLEAVQYCLLAAAGAHCSEEAVRLLLDRPTRLEIDDGCVILLKDIGETITDESFSSLEELILDYYPSWEKATPASLGRLQNAYLSGLPRNRLSPEATQRLLEWQRKFGKVNPSVARFRSGWVRSPIDDDAARRMSDGHWLAAMSKYSATKRRRLGDPFVGGAEELAGVLRRRASEEPERFANLFLKIPEAANVCFQTGILRGLEESKFGQASILEVLFAAHAAPGQPFGREISGLLENLEQPLSPAMVKVVEFYALDNRDGAEVTADDGESGKAPKDLYTDGMNSARGSAALAIAALISRSEDNFKSLRYLIDDLIGDDLTRVRACAVEALSQSLRYDRDGTVKLFLLLVTGQPDELLATDSAQRFFHYTHELHPESLRPLIAQMLNSDSSYVNQAGARHACLSYLYHPQDSSLVDYCLSNSTATRLGAAEMFSSNFRMDQVADLCKAYLIKLFGDGHGDVVAQAYHCFQDLPSGYLAKHPDLLRASLSSPVGRYSYCLLHALEQETNNLPELACEICESLLSDPNFSGDAVASLESRELSRIVFRLYSQTEKPEIRERCLDMIDRLVAAGIYESGRLLEKHDR